MIPRIQEEFEQWCSERNIKFAGKSVGNEIHYLAEMPDEYIYRLTATLSTSAKFNEDQLETFWQNLKNHLQFGPRR